MVSLIPYESSFRGLFIEWRRQPATVRHNPLKQMSDSEIAKMLRSEGSDLSDLRKYEHYRWFIRYDGVVVGNVSLKNVSHMMKYAEIGYGVSEAYQGKGVATAAARLLVEMVFHQSDLRKLIAYVHDKNVASRRVLVKLGFKQEGLLREHYLINGLPENEVLFGLLRHEWVHSEEL